MDFLSIGSLHTYTKNLEMQVKFNQKKEKVDLGKQPMSEIDLIQQQVDDDHKNDKLRKIVQKVEAGGKLTGEEKEYLKAKDPETYSEVEAREREQKDYEAALKRCKTKEDVQRLKTSKMGASLTKLKSVEHNPHIGIAEKLKIFMNEKLKLDKFEESTRKFVKDGGYEKLPTEAEESVARKEQAEQQRPETEKTEQSAKPEQDQDGKPGQTEPEGTEKAAPAEKKPELQRESKPSFEQESPEARKVRRAKAKAAYAQPEAEQPETGAVSFKA